jgi:ribonuclease BN (tRNA processing enzyme)
MRLTTLGGCGAWPTAGRACSGYLVEQDGFRVLIDPGYAVLPRLLEQVRAEALNAVLVTHGHPDHCADLNPLLRARAMSDDPPAALPVYAPAGALDAVLALDRPGTVDDAIKLHSFDPGERFAAGPFEVCTWLLPHWVPNAGLRLEADGEILAYTGDCGPSPDLLPLAASADVFLAEATYPRRVPGDSVRYLSSARDAGRAAARADVKKLMLTHLWPGTSPSIAMEVAAKEFSGDISVAGPDDSPRPAPWS